MAKGQKRSTRELRKPKQDKAPAKAGTSFGDQLKTASNVSTPGRRDAKR
jgi:hypothetical protein